MRGDILRLVGAPNESVILIIIFFGKTSFKDFVFAKSDILRLVGAPNEFCRFLIIYYLFKYSFGIKTTLPEPLWSKKNPFKGYIRQN